MGIQRNGARPRSRELPRGSPGLYVSPWCSAHGPARTRDASVTFEPGAHTTRHSHPLGQILILTAGCGRVQRWGGPLEEIRLGDVTRIAPGGKHRHAVAPTTAMTHIAIQERRDGGTTRSMARARGLMKRINGN